MFKRIGVFKNPLCEHVRMYVCIIIIIFHLSFYMVIFFPYNALKNAYTHTTKHAYTVSMPVHAVKMSIINYIQVAMYALT